MAAPASSTPDFLGELTIAPNCDALYPLGEQVATFNDLGILLRPGFGADFTLRLASGDWVVAEADHMMVGGFAPEKAASQFVDFTGDRLRAILSGYARGAQRLLDPPHPGFTAGLLAELLPAPVPQPLQPLASPFDLGRVLAACGASLNSLGELTLAAPPQPAACPTDDELLLASAVVFVAELDLTAWLLHVAACHPTSEVAQLLGALARGELYPSEWGGVLALAANYFRPGRRLQKRIQEYGQWSLLLQLFGVVYGQPGQLAALNATSSAFRFLRQALDQQPAGGPFRRGPILLAVRDGLELLARTAEAQAQVNQSLNFAQQALITAQLLAPFEEPAYTEAWLMHIIAQEAGYGWFKRSTATAPAPVRALEPALVWRFAGYAGTAALTMRIFCEVGKHWLKQGRVSNQLWTAAWRGLGLLRTALRQCYELGQQELQPGLPPPRPHGQEVMLKGLLGHYFETSQTLLAMHMQSIEVAQVLSMWAMVGTETEALKTLFEGYPDRYIAVRDALNEHGYGPEAIRCLGELVAALQI